MDKKYEPFGEEWEKEMMKMSKRQLIKMLRNELKTKKSCEGCPLLDQI